jgi:hypothetical protein
LRKFKKEDKNGKIRRYVEFNNKIYEYVNHVHTHELLGPFENGSRIGVSESDTMLKNQIGVDAIFILYNDSIYLVKGIFNFKNIGTWKK